ncbi:MAG: hypothetical protein JJU33_13190 [Phycisphaerales bacterium]|nr:hypothetical protein [Phycisphaerales bacterium]
MSRSPDPVTFNFLDQAENQGACFVIRAVNDQVAICLSLERNGDAEAVIDREQARSLALAILEFASDGSG